MYLMLHKKYNMPKDSFTALLFINFTVIDMYLQ
jgi:hypothetical protein